MVLPQEHLSDFSLVTHASRKGNDGNCNNHCCSYGRIPYYDSEVKVICRNLWICFRRRIYAGLEALKWTTLLSGRQHSRLKTANRCIFVQNSAPTQSCCETCFQLYLKKACQTCLHSPEKKLRAGQAA
jgi:hypothetical protein